MDAVAEETEAEMLLFTYKMWCELCSDRTKWGGGGGGGDNREAQNIKLSKCGHMYGIVLESIFDGNIRILI